MAAEVFELPVADRPRTHDRYRWTMPDGAVVLVRVTRVGDGVVWLRCHHSGRAWTRRHTLPLFASMVPGEWTTAELLETIS